MVAPSSMVLAGVPSADSRSLSAAAASAPCSALLKATHAPSEKAVENIRQICQNLANYPSNFRKFQSKFRTEGSSEHAQRGAADAVRRGSGAGRFGPLADRPPRLGVVDAAERPAAIVDDAPDRERLLGLTN